MFLIIIIQSAINGADVLAKVLGAVVFIIILTLIYNKRDRKAQKEKEQSDFTQKCRQIAKESGYNTVIGKDYYKTLYDELCEKCNPAGFMEPYDANKVSVANAIYSKLHNNKNDVPGLIGLRNKAIKELGLSFSTQSLYNKLCEIYNPQKFINENYNPDKVGVANKVFSEINTHRNDIVYLEKLAFEYGIVDDSIKMPEEEHGATGVGKVVAIVILLVLITAIVLILAYSSM